jgi:hypothetical protein
MASGVILFLTAEMNIAMGQKASILTVDDNAFPATLQYSPIASLDSIKENQSSTTIEKKTQIH